MSRNLLPSALTYLNDNHSVKIAHLVRLELSSSEVGAEVYVYLTDYSGDITWNSKTYEAGKVTKVGDIRQSQGVTNYKLSIDIAGEFQEELDRGLVSNVGESYVGKDIEVLRAYIGPAGEIVPFDSNTNGPMKYFIGDISDINITEGIVAGTSTVKWQCAGKFADFLRVSGRITDDTSHRGLVVNQSTKIPEGSDGAKKPSHQTDRGFQHANQSIHIVSKYLTTETKYKMKKRHFWQSDKLVAYEEEVEKEVELGVDLSAKFLPKIYGVRKVPGIPVFIDSLKSEPSHVYIVYAFAEGEVDSFLNFYVDGEPVICSSQEDKINRVCLGNQATGDTLSAFMTTSATAEIQTLEHEFYKEPSKGDYVPRAPIPQRTPTYNIDRTAGTLHTIDPDGSNEVVSLFTITNDTGTKEVTVFHGKDNQNASDNLVNIAAAGNFLRQEEWAIAYAETQGLSWGIPAEKQQAMEAYWDDSCKLLDTAYIVMKIAITEEEAEIPKIDAVISGCLVSTFSNTGVETKNQYSLNPVWQTLSYMRDEVCGGDMSLDLIDTKSFYDVAQAQDVVTDSYGNDFLNYWRYSGWKTAPIDDSSGHDPQKTVMQCNTLLKTEDTVTKNLQALLSQYDATLNILGGKYHLSVENDAAPIAHIDVSEIVGSIKTKDLSNKNKWNSVQASITDPAMEWGTNQVNFFNSEYLSKDNGVKKKGNIQFRHITNYYTARAWAKIQLDKSRYSRELSFDTYHKFTNLFPNANVTLAYPRFGYTTASPGNFRVKSSTLKANGLVSLVLEDYDSSIYVTSPASKDDTPLPAGNGLAPPTGLEFVPLPDARFNIASEGTIGTFGILVWDISKESSIMRYDVRDWLDIGSDITIPYSKVISDNGTDKAYLLVDNLATNTDYKFKVRSIYKSGKGSKYAYVPYFSGTAGPVSLPAVTNFVSTNATEGLFDGGTLDMTWDLVTDSSIVNYHIIVETTGGLTLRNETINKIVTSYSYTLLNNIADYSSLNSGDVGANRSFKIRIRTTNGLSEASPSFRASEWTDLI